MVYQELAVCPDLTVEANVMLGQESYATAASCDSPTNRLARSRRFAQLGHPEIRPRRVRCRRSTPPARQVVEIARARSPT